MNVDQAVTPQSSDGERIKEKKTLDTSLRRIRYLAFGTFGLAFGWVVLMLDATGLHRPITESEDDVAHQWHATIRRLGIEPIYPPQEDVSVGDIFLAVTEDRLEGSLSPAFQGRALKLWHVDVSAQLQETYSNLHKFPETVPRPKSNDEIWKQNEADGSVFKTGAERKLLPIVLFPGITLARIRQGTIGAGGGAGLFGLFGAASSDSQQTVELRVPAAESYGLPNLTATGLLNDFCRLVPQMCANKGARMQLSMMMGRQIHEKIEQAGHAYDGRHRFGIEILFVARVFLTRSIETVVESRSARGAQFKLAARLSEEAERIAAAIPAVVAPVPSAGEGESERLRRTLADQQARLSALARELSGSAPSGALSVHAADENRIAVTQTLERPVAIGIRTARRVVPEQ